jgi:DNA ligase (NAD+)
MKKFRTPIRAGLLAGCGMLLLAWPDVVAAPAAPVSTTPASSGAERLNPDVAHDRMRQLRVEIAGHDRRYHQDGAPTISDAAYDGLKRELRDLEGTFPELAAGVGPWTELADDRSGLFATARHREPMLSLEKAYSEPELRAFDRRVARTLGGEGADYLVEPKYDGFAISLIYENGVLVRAVTRGNGLEGDDLTTNLGRLRHCPRQLRATAPDGRPIPVPGRIEIRGEVFVTLAEYERYNREREAAGEPVAMTPRNLAVAAMRRRDAGAGCALELVCYAFGECLPVSALPETQRGWHERLRAWGLPAVNRIWPARGPAEILSAVQALRDIRGDLGFPTDGAVVKVNSLAAQRALGHSESAPRWAIAFKYAASRRVSQVLDITLQVGRTGVLTPVAELAPVEIDGTLIRRATLHNRSEIARRDVRVGDYVFVEKAGEIIPAIVDVNLTRRPASTQPYQFPERCPSCGGIVESQNGGVAVRCGNFDCPAQVRRRLEYFASRDAVEIAGLGPATIDLLVSAGHVRQPADFYRLNRAQLAVLGPERADQMAAAIAASRRAELWRFIVGLGIPQVGPAKARELGRRYRSLGELLEAGAQGEEVPATLRAFLSEPRQRASLTELIAVAVKPRVAGDGGVARSGVAGRSFVLTGTLGSVTRAEATGKIEAAGGSVKSTVTKGVDFLVVGEGAGTKRDQARAVGVTEIDEVKLLEMLRGNDEAQ